MTLPSSGLISTNDINVELGRAANTAMSLNDADVRALAGVPSGAIGLSDFYGKSHITVRNPLNNTVQNTIVGSGTVTASITYHEDGTCTVIDDGGNGAPGNWVTPTTSGIGSGYWFKYANQSGAAANVGGLTAGTWYQLSVARSLGLSRSAPGSISSVCNVYIATSASDSAIVASGQANFQATVDV